jgi:hypothetical protein
MDSDAQANELRLRLYIFCSECAHLIDLAEGSWPQRHVEGSDLIQHVAEAHAAWLAALDISAHDSTALRSRA